MGGVLHCFQWRHLASERLERVTAQVGLFDRVDPE